jgi:hypothetical protein
MHSNYLKIANLLSFVSVGESEEGHTRNDECDVVDKTYVLLTSPVLL